MAIAATPSASHAAPPDWLRAAAASPAGPAGSAVILLDDHAVTVSANGRTSAIRRYAVRVNDPDGRAAAMLREVYVTGSDKIKAIRGWVIRPGGGHRDLGDADVADVALALNDVYNEARARIIRASTDVNAGDVFGAEVETEGPLLFAQVDWPLQDRWAVRVARRTLTLPAGWRARSVTFNAAPLESRSQGTSFVWEARDLAEIPDEPEMPALSHLVPRLAVSFFGPNPQDPAGQFESWKDVASWADRLSASRAVPSAAVSARARELTSAAKADSEKIAAIARFAQRVQYVSIQTGLGRGGGYQPRAADEVLGRNYGDCKDKATLMRAMLAAVGIQARLALVYSGDPDYVRPEWPSPQQFNHAIVAVSVPADERGASVMDSALGRLLIFDPTDEFTPPGALPLHEQGGHALVVDGSNGVLVRLPLAPETDHAVTRTVEGEMSANGSLAASIVERATGDRAAERRATSAALDASQYRNLIERRVAAAVQGGRVLELAPQTDSGTGIERRMKIAADRFAQPMNTLLLIKVPFDLGDPADVPSRASRRTPIQVEPRVVEETVRISLPREMRIDEVPPDAAIETPFGRYSLRYSVENDVLIARRAVMVRKATVPAAEAAALHGFYERIRTADSTPVVLAKR